MITAVNAIGQHYLGEQRAAMAAFTLGLLVTFLAVRINTRLIRAKVKWWFHDIESEGGLHVHHMVIGVVLMVASGIGLIAFTPQGLWLQLCALLFGAGVALTLDEFALILRLQDVYWRAEGRLSVDAVIVAVCAGLLIILGFNPVGTGDSGLTGAAAAVAVAVTLVINLCFAVICLLKGKYWTGFFGIFIPIIGIVGAVRLARPNSPWAHKRYGKKPRRLARAQHREDRTNATWRAWREAFFDLIAGKPHLPSIPPADAGPAAGAEPAAGAADGAVEAGDAEMAAGVGGDGAGEPAAEAEAAGGAAQRDSAERPA
jgi:lysyl-tRNA synthetase class 2